MPARPSRNPWATCRLPGSHLGSRTKSTAPATCSPCGSNQDTMLLYRCRQCGWRQHRRRRLLCDFSATLSLQTPKAQNDRCTEAQERSTEPRWTRTWLWRFADLPLSRYHLLPPCDHGQWLSCLSVLTCETEHSLFTLVRVT